MKHLIPALLLAIANGFCSVSLSWDALSAQTSRNRDLIHYSRGILNQTVEGGTFVAQAIQETDPPHAGLFVTLVKNGKVRGCFGSLSPEGSSVWEQVREYTVSAATRDFRNSPIQASELNDIVIIISFIGPIESVSSIHEIDPKTEGLMVRSQGRAAVLLPGEARTASWQYGEALRQAGIRKNEPVELFKIHTFTVYEK